MKKIKFKKIINIVNKSKKKLSNDVVGVDLGTANTLLCIKNKGVVLNEPSVVAYTSENGLINPYLFGKRAKNMQGKTPVKMDVCTPLENGVISDYKIGSEMIKYFIRSTLGYFTIKRPIVIVGVPYNSTPVEKKAIQDSVYASGAKEVFLIHESMAAAIGAGLPIDQPHGSMIVDIGGGTSEIAVISLGGIVNGNSIRLAGNHMDDAIMEYIKCKYMLSIGKNTAEQIKIKIGAAYIKANEEPETMTIGGRDLKTGTPKEISVSSNDVVLALSEIINQIINNIRKTLESSPPELSADIVDRGIVLSGGGALLKNLDYIISEAINLPVFQTFNPETCMIIGLNDVIQNYKDYSYILYKEL